MIYLDTCLVIYLAEHDDHWSQGVRSAIEQRTGGTLAISPLVQAECLVGPLKRGDSVMEDAYEHLFREFRVLNIESTTFLDAARLRARFGLKMVDAIHLACAQHHGCDALWTNDSRLAGAAGGMAVDLGLGQFQNPI